MHALREKILISFAWPCGNVEHRRALAQVRANHLTVWQKSWETGCSEVWCPSAGIGIENGRRKQCPQCPSGREPQPSLYCGSSLFVPGCKWSWLQMEIATLPG